MGTGQVGEFPVGSLVRIRERDWIVLPSDDTDIVCLRPLSGSEFEICGIHRQIEGHALKHAEFTPPKPEQAGDFIAGKLLRNAARLGLRNGAGPFRSLGRLSVRPRPYQFVPLIMALKLETVRMLIADDVGIGKTIEAAMIARELLDRGDVQGLCVICPPHLCDQWQEELETKFHIHAKVVRTSTLARLESDLPPGAVSVYRYYKHLVVSIDFVKRDSRRAAFLSDCPDFVIVDEAHTATEPGGVGSHEQQQRHQLVHEVARDRSRHILLLTATPHSGIEGSFRSLLGLLNDRFENIDIQQLSEQQRHVLARHFVQRTRGDVLTAWPGEVRFPKRDPIEDTYKLTGEHQQLFEDVLDFTRETVQDPKLSQPRLRVRYWAALTLLRSLMSSPAAAAKAFAVRQQKLEEQPAEVEEQEDLRERETLDPVDVEFASDTIPEVSVELGNRDFEDRDRRRLKEFAKRAEALKSGNDPKIAKAADLLLSLIKKGFHPIVYCRFIPTAQYVARELNNRLVRQWKDFRAVAVTGASGSDEERKALIKDLVESEPKTDHRVLVATDCLSEGINLQDHFDAVLHYDLPWNPNRLEQREGRVDRFGQSRPEVKAVLLYSPDNKIDGIVLKVLVRKAREIYKSLGVSVPVPVNSESVMKAVIEGVFKSKEPEQMALDLGGIENIQQLHIEWDINAQREKTSRSRYAQHAINPTEVTREIEATDEVLGDPTAVRNFLTESAPRVGFTLTPRNSHFVLDPSKPLSEIATRLGWKKPPDVVFDSPPPAGLENAVVLIRNHPFVVGLSERVVGEAFKPQPNEKFARCGAAFTDAVKVRTVIALLRVRYRVTTRRHKIDQFAEEVVTSGFSRSDKGLDWLPMNDKATLALLETVAPKGQITQQERIEQVSWALQILESAKSELERIAHDRAKEAEVAYARLRELTGGSQMTVTPALNSPDILGIYVLLPGGGR
jgi:superfamily II DNA or RNA helicase